jgi:hypothetical protein
MIFIKKIFEEKIDDVVHRKFERFSVGEFNNRALISLVKGKVLKVKCSYDLVDDLFGLIAEKVSCDVHVKGKIIASRDFSNEIDFEVRDFKKGKKCVCDIDTDLSPSQMKSLYEKFKLNFILLNVEGEDFKLKVGKSLPKPGKELKDNFCSAVFPIEMINEFAWDVDVFRKIICKHKFVINEVVVPEGISDFSEARKLAKRRGKLVRIVNVDGKEIVNEKEFFV